MYIICFGTVLLMGLGGVLFSSFIFGAGQWPSDPSTLQLPPSISRKFTLELKDGIWMVSWWPPMRVCPQNAQPFTSTSSLHNHSNKLCARSAWTSVWIPTSCTNTPLYSCDRPEANDWRPSRRKTGSKSVSKPNCTTWKSAQKKNRKKKNSAAQRDIKQALQKGFSNLPGLLCWFFNRRTGEQRALSLRTRERRAAAFIMSCPDVMRPLYGHYAPHAPGAAAIVGNFPVSFPPLYSLETNQELFMCSPVFQFLKPDLLGQVRTKDTSQIRMFCTFTHLRILFVCLVYGSYIAYSTLCKVIYVKNT